MLLLTAEVPVPGSIPERILYFVLVAFAVQVPYALIVIVLLRHLSLSGTHTVLHHDCLGLSLAVEQVVVLVLTSSWGTRRHWMRMPNIPVRQSATPSMKRVRKLQSSHGVVQHNDCLSLGCFPFGIQVVCTHAKGRQYLIVRHVDLRSQLCWWWWLRRTLVQPLLLVLVLHDRRWSACDSALPAL